MSAPVRIQRSRALGWRMPAGAISVSRPGYFGNPFIVRLPDYPPAVVVRMFRLWLASDSDRAIAMMGALPELRGHDLACWCPLDQPCHADVLLELANT